MKKIQASPLLFFFISIILLLLHTDLTTANSGNLNDSFTASAAACDGSVECLVGDELLYNMLSQSSAGGTLNPNQAFVDCHIITPYRDCLPPINGGRHKQNCEPYNRDC